VERVPTCSGSGAHRVQQQQQRRLQQRGAQTCRKRGARAHLPQKRHFPFRQQRRHHQRGALARVPKLATRLGVLRGLCEIHTRGEEPSALNLAATRHLLEEITGDAVYHDHL
jgi:hypothetical protein